MQLSWDTIRANAIAFSKRWQGISSEKQQDQGFIEALLRVFGVEDSRAVGTFQEKTRIEGSTKWIDYLWKSKIAIEMKSRGENLDAALEQLRQYMNSIPEEDVPDLWLVSDFVNMRLSRRSTNDTWSFKTKDLHKNIKRFADIAGYETERVRDDQVEVNVKAAEKMAKLYDALRGHGYEGHELEVYLVRLLFCLFADDTGIFPKDSLFRYIEQSKQDGSDLTERIGKLFDILNMPPEARAKRTLLADELKQFRYINGNLFEKTLPMAEFDAKMRQILLDCLDFDWYKISPAIFGAMFQGVMDKAKRREMGAHYTSEENILKLINPLFMDDLWKEFERVKTTPAALDRFHEKIAKLKFLDPACGCGNFLIVTYGKLRELELEILKMKIGTSQMILDISPMLKVSVEQFYGIELEEFACQIAQVGMWLIDHQMNLRVSEQFGMYFARLPLTQGATVVHGNALRIDWEDIVPKRELAYLLGNPPFVGYSNQSKEQKEDMLSIYVDAQGKPFKTAGKIDYVAAWYYKAAKLIQGTPIRAAFVSTNSITQGEQVAAVWKPLFEMFGIHIDFGYRTFKWANEAKGKAAVHCVIIGFSKGHAVERFIYDGEEKTLAKNINPYLVDAPTIIVESRTKPLCDVPEMIAGGKPTDGGHLIMNEEQRDLLINAEPNAQKYIRRYYMGDDFINNNKRYCIWLVNCPPNELRLMPSVMKRVELVRQMRLNSTKAATRAKAETPMLFDEIRKITGEFYVAVPKVSSERRKYIPIGFLSVENIPGDKLFVVCEMGLYGFGILTSNVHMAWMRAVCGRLEMRYSYSNTIVYNNFPWPLPLFPSDGGVPRSGGVVTSAAKKLKRNTKAYYALPFNPALKQKARELRKAGVLSEVLLWLKLKNGQVNGWDFDRQKIIGNYIVDFYCGNIGLVVEIDGESHNYKAEYDSEREVFLKGLGLEVLHVLDSDVKRNIAGVVELIKNHPVGFADTPHHPAASRHPLVCFANWPGGHVSPSKGGEEGNVPTEYPTVSEEQAAQIEKLAQAVLDARANYPDSSLADLYDPLTMPPDLLKAHRALDTAVMKLYNFPVRKDFTEADCVVALMEMYQNLIDR